MLTFYTSSNTIVSSEVDIRRVHRTHASPLHDIPSTLHTSRRHLIVYWLTHLDPFTVRTYHAFRTSAVATVNILLHTTYCLKNTPSPTTSRCHAHHRKSWSHSRKQIGSFPSDSVRESNFWRFLAGYLFFDTFFVLVV